ncbi:cyanase [Deinococcus sp.]|uniref:cyanase n=1 Tax=Deinococcus sp. TaxID=47478 RepID=UPI0025C6752F|nr:cyanase [Deinococcus sp.]
MTHTAPPPCVPLPHDLLGQVQAARHEQQLTLADLAARIGTDRVWLAAALDGQHPFSLPLAQTLLGTLGLDPAHAVSLTCVPMRGAFQTLPPTDPTVYRLYEVLQVYGPALKTLIHEEFGDGIMSAINFRLELRREPHPDGDRVVITMAGKFLPYHWAAPEP